MRLFLIFLFISIFTSTFAQDTVIDIKVVKPHPIAREYPEDVIAENKIFQVVEQMPQYPGGDEAMMKFIRNSIVYPDTALVHNVQGRVVVGFIVEEDGSLTGMSIKRGVSKELDAEALRVVKLAPKFKPGKQQGKTVRVAYVLPILFQLPGSGSSIMQTRKK